METTIVVTLSHNVGYEGYGAPETIIFEKTSKELGDEFILRIFRSIIRHPLCKSVQHENWGDSMLFVNLNANVEKWKLVNYQKNFKKLFGTTRIPHFGIQTG